MAAYSLELSTTMRNRNSDRRLVPAIVGGKPVLVDPSQISGRQWVEAHGTTIAGVQVNSPRFTQVGDSFIIQGSGGKASLSMLGHDAELLAVTLARQFGYTVTAPGQQSA